MFYILLIAMDIKKVIDWNEKAWNERWAIDNRLESKLLMEEAMETVYAHATNDKIEIVDWLIDVMFVAIWTLHKLWLTEEQITQCYEEVCRSNFSKLPFVKTEDGKVKKWPNFTRPDFTNIINING